jgi:hypothetical protein
MIWPFNRRRRDLEFVLANQEMIMSALADLTTEVTKIAASVDAAVAILDRGSSDATQLAALTSQLSASQAKLDAAVAAAQVTTPSS